MKQLDKMIESLMKEKNNLKSTLTKMHVPVEEELNKKKDNK
jgi:hypothetical protein